MLNERVALIALAGLCIAGIIVTAALGVANSGLQELAGLIVSGILGAGAGSAIVRERQTAAAERDREAAIASWNADE